MGIIISNWLLEYYFKPFGDCSQATYLLFDPHLGAQKAPRAPHLPPFYHHPGITMAQAVHYAFSSCQLHYLHCIYIITLHYK